MTIGIIIVAVMAVGSFIAVRHGKAAARYDKWLDETAPVTTDNKL